MPDAHLPRTPGNPGDAHLARTPGALGDPGPAAYGQPSRPGPTDLWNAAAARPAGGPSGPGGPPPAAPPAPGPARRRRVLPVALAAVLVLVLAAAVICEDWNTDEDLTFAAHRIATFSNYQAG
ncbi:hypothetical protein ABT351_31545, partial [Micromonospora sp. NPDC000018]